MGVRLFEPCARPSRRRSCTTTRTRRASWRSSTSPRRGGRRPRSRSTTCPRRTRMTRMCQTSKRATESAEYWLSARAGVRQLGTARGGRVDLRLSREGRGCERGWGMLFAFLDWLNDDGNFEAYFWHLYLRGALPEVRIGGNRPRGCVSFDTRLAQLKRPN